MDGPEIFKHPEATPKIMPEDPMPEPTPEPVRRYIGTYWVCGYDLCEKCCGKTDEITASGAMATVGRTAASVDLPFGTVIYIEGIGERVIEDAGVMSKGVIDVLCNDHPECYAITGQYAVYIVEGATA